jgi:hypothetical protein
VSSGYRIEPRDKWPGKKFQYFPIVHQRADIFKNSWNYFLQFLLSKAFFDYLQALSLQKRYLKASLGKLQIFSFLQKRTEFTNIFPPWTVTVIVIPKY